MNRLVLACLAATLCLAASAQELDARLKATPPAHPRLFLKQVEEADLKAKIDGDPLLKGAFNHLIASADALQAVEPVKREKVGRRLLGVSRTCLQRLSYLAFAYRMTKGEAYLRRAEREMLAVAGFVDWNPSHFLDVAEMTAALAIGYDWLYDGLTPEARSAIRDAIVEKGLKASFPAGSWVLGKTNWNPVCHGGLTVGALAVWEDAPDLAQQVIQRAIRNVPLAMAEYAPDGVYPEGPGYWAYGTTYNVLLIAALESALGTDFGLAQAEAFMKTPEFYLQATGPTGLYFNYSDCGARGGVAPAMYWFATRAQNPGLLWHEKGLLAELTAETPGRGGSERLLPLLFIWARPIGEIAPPATLHWKGDGRTPVAFHRSGWDAAATFLAVKGGSPSTNHAHMDIGSFVLDMEGQRWAIDLGSQGYESLESKDVNLWNMKQDSQRWTVFRLSNVSHNTLVVDGQCQRVAGNASIARFSGAAEAPYTIVDMTPAYEGQLAQAQRGVRLLGRSALIQDEIRANDKQAHVRWGMATHAEVAISGNATATLTQDGKTVTLRVLAPAGVQLATYAMEKPPQPYDAENPNTRMVGFEFNLAAQAPQTLTVLIEPGPAAGAPPEVKALKDW